MILLWLIQAVSDGPTESWPPSSQLLPFKSVGKLYQLSAHGAFIKLAQWQAGAHHNEMSIA